MRKPKRSKKNIDQLDLQQCKLDQVTESINLYMDLCQLFFKAFLQLPNILVHEHRKANSAGLLSQILAGAPSYFAFVA